LSTPPSTNHIFTVTSSPSEGIDRDLLQPVTYIAEDSMDEGVTDADSPIELHAAAIANKKRLINITICILVIIDISFYV
jgi:t-SNARE complex subunit (syntaxin)